MTEYVVVIEHANASTARQYEAELSDSSSTPACLVTDDTNCFPVRSRPEGLVVQRPQAFLLAQLSSQPDRVLAATRSMSQRHQRPPRTPEQLAGEMAVSEPLPAFGELAALLAFAAVPPVVGSRDPFTPVRGRSGPTTGRCPPLTTASGGLPTRRW